MFDLKPGESPFTSTVFTVAAQVGCLTLILILVALISGLGLDRWFNTLPLFTILFLVGSMPLSWVMVYWVVRRSKHKFIDKPAEIPNMEKPSAWEDENSD